MKTENSTNIHVFRVNRAAVTTKIREPPTQTTSIKVNSRTSLSAETKRLICEDHINNPKYTQEALASKYGCKRTTVAKVKETYSFVVVVITNYFFLDYKIEKSLAFH